MHGTARQVPAPGHRSASDCLGRHQPRPVYFPRQRRLVGLRGQHGRDDRGAGKRNLVGRIDSADLFQDNKARWLERLRALGPAGRNVGTEQYEVQDAPNKLASGKVASPPKTWHHLALAFKGSAIQASIDGAAGRECYGHEPHKGNGGNRHGVEHGAIRQFRGQVNKGGTRSRAEPLSRRGRTGYEDGVYAESLRLCVSARNSLEGILLGGVARR